ncbi:membrane protein [Bradyrhizobium sp. SSBR45G]|uniref:CbtA family protein n=1 Tax=unclassified Bradyrhizobium TaxID=2631580 RepID=UPI002342AADA|nr:MULTISPECIES: CbtA family protein [unclassified Bradyrhizobium]GLH79431.1 membrane protein [Bradyrhizobium sp. SSBR45G]GLH86808.1 membrane protein [Bradyrhizobium sp. SSBR45R]
MTGRLLLRGMLAGLVAALLSFGFLKLAGESSVERAIAFETAADAAKAKASAEEAAAKGQPAPVAAVETELVSRPVQAGVGLLTGVVVYSTAFGGLFALAFALCFRRMADLGPRATSAVLAALGFVAVYAAPMLKYPANPPSVGLAETIGMRTSLYFALILISLAVIIAAGMLRIRLLPRLGAWNAALIAAGVYVAVMIGISLALPDVNEVPEEFPATVLWQFRVASLGGQAIMWATLGLLFGVLAERLMAPHGARA